MFHSFFITVQVKVIFCFMILNAIYALYIGLCMLWFVYTVSRAKMEGKTLLLCTVLSIVGI